MFAAGSFFPTKDQRGMPKTYSTTRPATASI
jgi:hypothetical protein